ncbi:DUF6230 family protein [Kitasatospora sp. GP82]|uniref:DUF6230 family protein n=1 Tax=Kitasatospora sp. GP82 TaxID=3035089 RepID=UPI002473206A|nr:DUF6230 family protein [Kitasatospora sp. GP82]MDH6128020.1 hypothetical protein [Kitasatospora sp. GP82]
MSQTFGKTRWKRFALVMVPSIAATAAIGVGLANNALAASFSISGQKFKVQADDLQGDNFAQYGDVLHHTNAQDQNPKAHEAVAVSTFSHATIKHLCQSVSTDLPFGLGKWTLQLHAGGDNKDQWVQADNLVIGLNSLEADAQFDNINIGQDASTLPSPAKGMPGLFGQAATHAHLTNVKQTAWSTSASSFSLNGLKLGLAQGDGPSVECF